MIDDLRITQTLELHPTKAKKPGEKRLMNTVLITYAIENKSPRPQSVGARVCMDTFVIDNDGCLFAAPTHPKKVLDGVVLKDKTLPPFVQMLQRPNIDNPGFVSHLTLDIGGRFEKMDKVVLSSLQVGFGEWDMPVAQANGDSAISAYWATKDMKPGTRRGLAYAYGEGVAVRAKAKAVSRWRWAAPSSRARSSTSPRWSPIPRSAKPSSLELPKGMQRLEGKEVQPVAIADDQETSTVMWKARVEKPGEYTIRVRSSAGMTVSKVVTITAENN